MKIDPSCCRLCFIYDEDPIDIFGDTLTESRITDLLAQYFMDQVNMLVFLMKKNKQRIYFNHKKIFEND